MELAQEILKEIKQDNARQHYYHNKEQHKQGMKRYLKQNPWVNRVLSARSRCTNPNVYGYNYCGGAGIKCLLTISEAKELWFRDKADKMDKPCLERIDTKGDFSISNCRFVESWQAQSRRGKRLTRPQVNWGTVKKYSSKRKAEFMDTMYKLYNICAFKDFVFGKSDSLKLMSQTTKGLTPLTLKKYEDKKEAQRKYYLDRYNSQEHKAVCRRYYEKNREAILAKQRKQYRMEQYAKA